MQEIKISRCTVLLASKSNLGEMKKQLTTEKTSRDHTKSIQPCLGVTAPNHTLLNN